jgi:hypothetical protein
MSYPPDFQSWPLERRNAWFADEAAAYRESRHKVNGNGAAAAQTVIRPSSMIKLPSHRPL